MARYSAKRGHIRGHRLGAPVPFYGNVGPRLATMRMDGCSFAPRFVGGHGWHVFGSYVWASDEGPAMATWCLSGTLEVR